MFRRHRYHRPIRPLAMASESPTTVFAGQPLARLAGQLQSLSELTESVAYRLLELEERLAAQELRLQPLLEGPVAADPQMADTELRLDDTEDRLTRLEALLSGLAGSGAARQVGLAAVPPSGMAEEPFFEEGEQPFMDELADPEPEALDEEQESLTLAFDSETADDEAAA